MGFLSSLLTVGGAIAGSFVGMPQVGAAIGGAIGGSIDQSSASSDASSAQIAAQQQAIAARQYAASQVGALENPFVQSGYTANNALTARLGLPTGAVTGATPGTGNPLAYNPGQPGSSSALTPSASASSSPLTGSAGQSLAVPLTGAAGGGGSVSALTTPAATAATLAGAPTAGGVAPVSSLPTGSPTTSTTPVAAATDPSAIDPNSAAAGATSPAAVSAGGVDPGTYGSTANPTAPAAYTAPSPFSYTLDDYKASPAYAYQLDQANKNTLANAAVTGATQSGAAMKALQDRAQNIAYTDFTNERQFANGVYQQGVGNALNAYDTNYNVYNTDRNYLTGRSDNETNNLFKLSGQGQQAATVDANAAVGAGTGIASSDTAIGQAGAQNALTQGQIGSNLATGLVAPVTQAVGRFVNGVSTPTGTDPAVTLPQGTSFNFTNF